MPQPLCRPSSGSTSYPGGESMKNKRAQPCEDGHRTPSNKNTVAANTDSHAKAGDATAGGGRGQGVAAAGGGRGRGCKSPPPPFPIRKGCILPVHQELLQRGDISCWGEHELNIVFYSSSRLDRIPKEALATCERNALPFSYHKWTVLTFAVFYCCCSYRRK